MNINELTLGQIRELQKLFSETKVLGESENWGKQIVILQRGWVIVGDITKNGEYFTCENGYIIRRWGTTNGLGQLASEGKQSETKLEPTPKQRFHELTVINFIKCNEEKWK
jgi:hypothetical protein